MPDGLRAFAPAEALRPQRPLLQPTLGDAQPPLAQAAPTDLHPCAGTATPPASSLPPLSELQRISIAGSVKSVNHPVAQ